MTGTPGKIPPTGLSHRLCDSDALRHDLTTVPPHGPCTEILKSIVEPLATTTPVLTEAFHLLSPGSVGAANLIHFIADGGLTVWFLSPDTLDRAFALMREYADHPMDLADASLVVMAETQNLHRVFTIDRRDFATYRIKRRHRQRAFELLQPTRARK